MVDVLIGDLFESKAQTLVNTVNCVGVMGKGVALEFKKRFPDMYDDYVLRCRRGEVSLGRPYLYRRLLSPWVLNFPTKDHWRSLARLDSIVDGLEHLLEHYQAWGITSLAIPPLGCGEGQLEWRVVGPLLYMALRRLEIQVEMYAPYGTPPEQLDPVFLTQEARSARQYRLPSWLQPGWVALVEILRRLQDQPYHYPIGRTIFQKIAYVATQEGLPTGLTYQRGSYGPFAPGLRALETWLLNSHMLVEQQMGRMFSIQVGPAFEHVRSANVVDLARWAATIERVVDLFLRMDTREAELAATVLFASRSLSGGEVYKPSEQDVVGEVLDWKQRRKPAFDEASVALTVRNLAALGWLDVRASPDLRLQEHEALYG